MEPSRPTVRPVVLLSLVGALVIAFRVQTNWLEGTTSRQGLGFASRTIAETAELRVPIGTFALAAVVSLIAAVVTKRRVNRILAMLVAAVVGGLVTERYNAMPGVALGGAIGALVAWAIVRRAVLAALLVIAALFVGVVGGAAVLALTGNPGDGWHGPLAWSMSALACVAGSLLVWRALRGPAQRRWLRLAGHGVLLLAVVAGQWLSLSVDTLRRVWWLGAYYKLCLIPCDESWLHRGFVGVNSFAGGRRVTDRQLATIGGWKEIYELVLVGATVTDAGLSEIGRLTSLFRLSIQDAPITDDGTKHLAGLTGLIYLDLQGTQITDEGLRQLAGVQSLFRLDLSHTRVTDEGLAHLKSLPYLTHLQLAGTPVTTAGLTELAGLPNLRELDVRQSAVRGVDLPLLRAKLPRVRIEIDGERQ